MRIKGLLIKPDEIPSLIEFEESLENLQRYVGGNIEIIQPFEDDDVDVIINEEGKLIELTPNLYYGQHDILCGNVIFIRNEEGESASITKEDEELLKIAVPKITIPEEKANMLKNNISNFIGFEFVESDRID